MFLCSHVFIVLYCAVLCCAADSKMEVEEETTEAGATVTIAERVIETEKDTDRERDNAVELEQEQDIGIDIDMGEVAEVFALLQACQPHSEGGCGCVCVQ